MKISERLQQAIDSSGMRKKDIAAMAGMSQVTLSKYISGVVVPKKDNLTKIAKALGKDLSYFYSEEDEKDLLYWKEKALAAEKKLGELKGILPLISEANTRLSKIVF